MGGKRRRGRGYRCGHLLSSLAQCACGVHSTREHQRSPPPSSCPTPPSHTLRLLARSVVVRGLIPHATTNSPPLPPSPPPTPGPRGRGGLVGVQPAWARHGGTATTQQGGRPRQHRPRAGAQSAPWRCHLRATGQRQHQWRGGGGGIRSLFGYGFRSRLCDGLWGIREGFWSASRFDPSHSPRGDPEGWHGGCQGGECGENVTMGEVKCGSVGRMSEWERCGENECHHGGCLGIGCRYYAGCVH